MYTLVIVLLTLIQVGYTQITVKSVNCTSDPSDFQNALAELATYPPRAFTSGTCGRIVLDLMNSSNFSNFPDSPYVVSSLRRYTPLFRIFPHLKLRFTNKFLLTEVTSLYKGKAPTFTVDSVFTFLSDSFPVLTLGGSLFWMNLLLALIAIDSPYSKSLTYVLIVVVAMTVLITPPTFFESSVVFFYFVLALSAISLNKQDRSPGNDFNMYNVNFFFVANAFYWALPILKNIVAIPPLYLATPTVMVLVSTSFLASYAFTVSKLAKYALPSFLILCLCTVYLTVIPVLDQVPIVFRDAPLSNTISPLLEFLFENFFLATSPVSALLVPLEVGATSLNNYLATRTPPPSPNAQFLLDCLQSPEIQFAIAIALLYVPSFQMLYLDLQALVGRRFPVVKLPSTFWYALYQSYARPLLHLIPSSTSTHVLLSCWNHLFGGDAKNKVFEDITALIVAYGIFLFHYIFRNTCLLFRSCT